MLTFEERVLCGKPLQRFGSVLEPDPEPTQEFGPVATTRDMVANVNSSDYIFERVDVKVRLSLEI